MLNIIKHRLLKKSGKISLKFLKKIEYCQEANEYYFAYGANLNSKRFQENSIPYLDFGKACLKKHKISFSLPCEYKLKGFANVIEDENHSAWGKLYKVSKMGLFLLDILEWVPFKFYRRELVEVVNNDGITLKAWTYKAINPKFNLFPPEQYLNLIISKSIEEDFPKDYIDYLRTIKPKNNFELDFGFRLSNPSKRRWFEKELISIYRYHDVFREKLSRFI